MRPAKRPCAAPGCAGLVDRGYCSRHQAKAEQGRQQYEIQRGGSAARGYDSTWRRFRVWFLSQPENVICADCGGLPSVDVHHIRKVRLFPQLRLDPANCLGLCHGCHSARTITGQ